MALEDVEQELLYDFLLPAAPRRGAARRGERRQRRRVQERLLRAPIPETYELKDALSARAAVQEATRQPLRALLLDNDVNEDSTCSGPCHGNGVERRWDKLLQHVRSQQLPEVVKELGKQAKVEPFQLDMLAKDRFLWALRAFRHKLTVSYHGTKEHNLKSIAEKGLLVPGEGGVKVANGSANGVGVYTARIGAASLSKGFCNTGKMLVCAVCDTSESVQKEKEEEARKPVPAWAPSMHFVQTHFPPPAPSAATTKREVTRQSDQVIHVGDAVVVFKSECVAPLFVVDTEPEEEDQEEAPKDTSQQVKTIGKCEWKHHALVPLQDTSWSCPQQIGRRRIVAPEDGKSVVKFGGEDKVGDAVWLPPLPLESTTKQQQRLKRRQVQRQWQRLRRKERGRKCSKGPEDYQQLDAASERET